MKNKLELKNRSNLKRYVCKEIPDSNFIIIEEFLEKELKFSDKNLPQLSPLSKKKNSENGYSNLPTKDLSTESTKNYILQMEQEMLVKYK